MANQAIVLGKDAGIKVKSVEVQRVQYLTDGSGNWQIDFGVNFEWPVRTPNQAVTLRETYRGPFLIQGSVLVGGEDMAAASGIPKEALRTTLTLDQTETLITQLAMVKVFAVLGIPIV